MTRYLAFLFTLLVTGGIARAELARGVSAAFKGQIIVTKAELAEGKSDKETIAKIKSEKLSEITGEAKEDVTYWTFHYTAFLNKPGATKLKMEFHRDGKQYVADKQLEGVDPKSTVLSGEISIDEDEGVAKGKSYTIKLVNDKNVTVAQTTLLMK